jgi:NADPH-dependent 2,4-dienoyl-CoA reductase/sulfur reductase-like enzyme/nitrite reductase/ring-hydroxylating ferredoxin subunit
MGNQSGELSGPDLENGIAISELADGVPLLGHAGGEAVVVVKQGEQVFATGASCTHYGGPLAEGIVVGNTIHCPWHHACFSLETGEALWAAALAPVACYDVTRQGKLIKIGKKRTPVQKNGPSGPSAPKRIVLIGAGAAGAACAEMLRAEGYTGGITLIGAEEPGPVDRPNLSKDYLAGTAPEEWTLLGTPDHYREIAVELLPDDPVVELSLKDQAVHLRSGRWLSYDALLIATGSEPRRLPIPGADLPHVRTLRTQGDSKSIILRVREGMRVVVIGSSFIGLEAAASLRKRKAEVTVVAPDPVPLARILGPELGNAVLELHRRNGVEFHLGKKPTSIDAEGVTLEGGEKLPADLVILGVGVRPRTELAEKAGLEVKEGGVIVDERLQTSHPGVYAAGDIARYPDVGGEHARIEHWVVAERQGQAAARAMIGRLDAYKKPPFFWSAHYDLVINYVGNGAGFDRHEVHGDPSKGDVLVAYRKADRIVAVATIGRDQASLRVEDALERGDQAALEAIVGGQ